MWVLFLFPLVGKAAVRRRHPLPPKPQPESEAGSLEAEGGDDQELQVASTAVPDTPLPQAPNEKEMVSWTWTCINLVVILVVFLVFFCCLFFFWCWSWMSWMFVWNSLRAKRTTALDSCTATTGIARWISEGAQDGCDLCHGRSKQSRILRGYCSRMGHPLRLFAFFGVWFHNGFLNIWFGKR